MNQPVPLALVPSRNFRTSWQIQRQGMAAVLVIWVRSSLPQTVSGEAYSRAPASGRFSRSGVTGTTLTPPGRRQRRRCRARFR